LPLPLAKAEVGPGNVRGADSDDEEIPLTARSAGEPEAAVVGGDAEMHGPEEGTRSGLVHAGDPFRSGTAADEKEGKVPLAIGGLQMGQRESMEYVKIEAEQITSEKEGLPRESEAVEESVKLTRSPDLESTAMVESGMRDVSGGQSQTSLGRLVLPCSLAVDAPRETSFLSLPVPSVSVLPFSSPPFHLCRQGRQG